MIDIYTEKEPGYIYFNDDYFDLYTAKESLSEREISVIQQIDNAIVTEDKHIITRFGTGTIGNLSSGGKTVLNIMKHPECVFSVEGCGPNALNIIFALDSIKIYMSRPSVFEMLDGITLRFNDKDVVEGRSGYQLWWSKEYKERSKDV